jgi:hypothetical protein
MPIRTVQILGQGYGSTPAQITVTARGNTVFSGTVDTVNQPLPALPNPEINLNNVLCTFEIDTAFVGEIPMTCAVSAGTVIFSDIYTNYALIPNPVYTLDQRRIVNSPDTTQADRVAIYTQVAVPALSQSDIDVLLDLSVTSQQKNTIVVAHNCTTHISSGASGHGPIVNTDPRNSVVINGTPQTMNDRDELTGAWWWTINAGSTMTYQLTVDPAIM